MKKLVVIMAAALTMMSCGQDYIVRGNIAGLSGEVKLMQNKGNDCYATAVAEEGVFEMVVDTDAPLYANLVAGDKKLTLFVEEGVVNVEGSVEEWSGITVSGTPANDGHSAYRQKTSELMSAYMAAATEEEREVAAKAFDENIYNFYEENKSNIFGLYLLSTQIYYEMTPDEILEAVEALPKELHSSPSRVALKEHAEGMKRVDVGQKFIDLELPDKDGNMVKLSDVLAESKYVLLDFWASWCGPCMREVPFLVADYATYHAKGFEIYGVSLDREREPWIKAMESKGLVWPNVSELQYWNDPSAKLYAVRSIPSNFLIASDGTIVARNLRGEELGAKLAELLK